MTLWIIRLAVAVATAVALTGQPVEQPVQQSAPEALGTLEAESFRINLPLSWEEQDLSNRTYLSATPEDVRAHFREPAPDGDGASVLFQYTAEPAHEDSISDEWITEALEEGRTAMAGLPPEELQYVVQDKGHGCLDGFQLVRGPETVATSGNPGRHFAVDYEYGCYNSGVPVRGWAWIAYSPDGRRHNIFMTAPEDVWISDFDTLQTVASSVSLPE